ncbi:hypothetical protein VP01_2576g7 [Puccinia sorghi]|uniref:Reverse transcriptase Ty1/copia-type domain-containing protein n=1 Tax=Puccinia sorghi TaxID=27349 RepID=A0A0L6V5J2_9BASI|nr:hypothetical protein VP01_2576g7 [Puccinia sorghi]
MLLMFAIEKNLSLKQFDVKNAFLYAPPTEELYINTPEGSKRTAPFLKLKKSLYCLKQAPANWYITLTKWFDEIYFKQSTADSCLFIRKEKKSYKFFYADDLLVAVDVDEFEERCSEISSRKTDSQRVKYLEEFQKLNLNYRTFTGILNYLSCQTRPDLAPHWKQFLHVWKYLKGSKDLILSLRPRETSHKNELEHYTDATCADDLETCLSRSGSICFWKNCPITWNSKKKKNITLSSTEAEMNALADGAQENQWIKFVSEELWNEELEPTTFKIDNQGLAEKIKHFGSNSKTKHLDIKTKWLRDLKKYNQITVQLISSEDMVANTLTKASSFDSLKRLQERFLVLVLATNHYFITSIYANRWSLDESLAGACCMSTAGS